jgi:hypothetical protein
MSAPIGSPRGFFGPGLLRGESAPIGCPRCILGPGHDVEWMAADRTPCTRCGARPSPFPEGGLM